MCDCVATTDAAMKEHNTAIVVPLLGPARCLVETYRIEKRRDGKRPVHLFANYCPFCGEKYPKEDETLRG